MRADWMDGRLRTNVTAFYSDLEDLQTTAATPDGQFLTTNAGGLEVPGLKRKLRRLPTDNWQIFAALGWQNAEYQSYRGVCRHLMLLWRLMTRTVISLSPSEAHIKLTPLGRQPISVLASLTLTPNVMVRYLGAQYPATRNQGYRWSVTLINAGVKLSAADSQWELNLECKNCGDKAIHSLSCLRATSTYP